MHGTMPFRILHVAGGLPGWGGTEKYVLDISAALASRGYAVTLACPRASLLAQRAETLGLRRIVLEMGSAFDWKQLTSFLRVLAGNYDIVHTHSPLDYIVPAIAARICRIPVVMTRHMPQPFASARNAYICASLLYDRIITASSFVRTLLIESGARSERIDVVPNGIVPFSSDPGAGLRLRQELSIPRDAVLIAAAGRMSSDKGFDVLLKAVSQLNLSGVTLYCVIFGAGKVLQQLRTLSADLQVDSRVRLPGFRRDVHDLWCAADIAVVPSVWSEPFGYVALEALSAGCPLVASRVGGLPEVVSSDSGVLTEPGDVEGIAAAIRDLVLSPELRKRMHQAARKRAKMFTLDANVAGVEQVYASILGWKDQMAMPLRRPS